MLDVERSSCEADGVRVRDTFPPLCIDTAVRGFEPLTSLLPHENLALLVGELEGVVVVGVAGIGEVYKNCF